MSLLTIIRGKSKSDEQDSPSGQMSISDQMEVLKVIGGDADNIKTKVIEVLVDPDKIQYTAMLSEAQLREIQNLQILNSEFFEDSPLLDAVIDLQMNLSVSRDGYGRKSMTKLAQLVASDMEQINKSRAHND
ncbi:MAG: hypothetical protein KAW93_08005 [Methanogenium sp.]|nr:hypothetical protein [Methanogenium sp.]